MYAQKQVKELKESKISIQLVKPNPCITEGSIKIRGEHDLFKQIINVYREFGLITKLSNLYNTAKKVRCLLNEEEKYMLVYIGNENKGNYYMVNTSLIKPEND